ncbi:MAG: hypothetical protein IT176_08095 [Acidobacteria bacterium]|nr:hypothetical protein [Acidobacteriota bacterium]
MSALERNAGEVIPELGRHQRPLLAAGALGLAVCAIGWVLEPAQFYQSYLMAYMLCLGVTLGCLALGMVHQLSGGAWGVVIRRPIGAASRVLPVMTVLFLPIVAGMQDLYVWTRPGVVAGDALLQHKQLYLNVPFFLARAGLYFIAWNVISHLLNKWGLEQDQTGDPQIARRMQRLSAGGLLVYGLTITFASFDWLMSIAPHWYSTIYGVIIIGGQGLSAIAFLIIVLEWLSRRPPLDTIIAKSHFHDLGNLLLAFVMLWAYFSFSQFLIIWAGNLPREIEWYVHRLQTSWMLLGGGLILFHFAVPLVLLLLRAMKREARLLVRLAVFMLLARLLDLYWLVAPDFHERGLALSWLDLALPLSLGTFWAGCFVYQLRRRPILPVHDPEFDEALGDILERGRRPSTAH